MCASTLDVDQETYDCFSDYIDRMRICYKQCLAENESKMDDLSAQLRGLERLHAAYVQRLSGLDLLLDGLNVAPLPFTDKEES